MLLNIKRFPNRLPIGSKLSFWGEGDEDLDDIFALRMDFEQVSLQLQNEGHIFCILYFLRPTNLFSSPSKDLEIEIIQLCLFTNNLLWPGQKSRHLQ